MNNTTITDCINCNVILDEVEKSKTHPNLCLDCDNDRCSKCNHLNDNHTGYDDGPGYIDTFCNECQDWCI